MKKKGLTKLACLGLSVALLVSGNGILISASEPASGGKNSTTETPIGEVPYKINDLATENSQNTGAPAAEGMQAASAPTAGEAQGTSASAMESMRDTSTPAAGEIQAASAPATEATQGTSAPEAEETQDTSSSEVEDTQDTSAPEAKETQGTSAPAAEETPTTAEPTTAETLGTSASAAATSEHTVTDKTADEETKSIIVIDPLYEAGLTSEELEELKASLQASTFAGGRAATKLCTTVDEAAKFVRGQMVDRDTAVTIQVPTSFVSSYVSDDKFVDDILQKAMAYSEGCSGQEGDALKWGRFGYSATVTNLGTNTQVAYTFAYHSTADQEWELTEKVEAVLADLNLNGKSDYEKVRAIHDWICRNVKNEEDTGNAARYSAYSAACLGKAVCQGYAVLFYRMCKDAGLSQVRVVVGTMNGGAHGWNLIYLKDGTSTASAKSRETTGGAWYNVDCAWDGQGSEPKYTYFLKADDAFPGHVRYPEYDGFPKAEKSYLVDGGMGWNLTPVYSKKEIKPPYDKVPGYEGMEVTTSNGGRLYRSGNNTEYKTSLDTSGKNKVYVFLQSSCPRSLNLSTDLNNNIGKFEDTDIYLISTLMSDDGKADIAAFKQKISSSSGKLNFMYHGQYLQHDWLNYTLQPAGKSITENTPIVIYVDGNNKIQYATFDSTTAGAVRQNLDAYCSSSGESEPSNLDEITYHKLDGGMNHPGNPSRYRAGLTTMMLQAPTRDGYTFEGWYSDASCTNKVTGINQSMSGDLNFYANWVQQPTITYELDGGINDSHNPPSYNKGANEIPLFAPVKNGYIFAGWHTDAAKTQKLADNKL